MLTSRLDNRWETRQALQRFADELDSADADPVVAALMLAADRGAVGASTTLRELAETPAEIALVRAEVARRDQLAQTQAQQTLLPAGVAGGLE